LPGAYPAWQFLPRLVVRLYSSWVAYLFVGQGGSRWKRKGGPSAPLFFVPSPGPGAGMGGSVPQRSTAQHTSPDLVA
jgi:hypothetical protein